MAHDRLVTAIAELEPPIPINRFRSSSNLHRVCALCFLPAQMYFVTSVFVRSFEALSPGIFFYHVFYQYSRSCKFPFLNSTPFDISTIQPIILRFQFHAALVREMLVTSYSRKYRPERCVTSNLLPALRFTPF